MTTRGASDSGRAVRMGFSDPAISNALLTGEQVASLNLADSSELLADFGAAADPDQALRQFVRLLEVSEGGAGHRLRSALGADRDFRRRLIDVLGLSEGLGDFLIRHPSAVDVISQADELTLAPSAREGRARLLSAVGAHPEDPEPVASVDHQLALDSLRIEYRRQLLGIAARDISGIAGMESVAQWLSDLADNVLETALAIARAEVGLAADTVRIAVIGMGKCGARELNYISDVDVIFVSEPAEGVADEDEALRVATALASGVMRACTTVTREGAIWEVDAGLRPEGKQGALVRTLESHVAYYTKWAKTWEFQALLKARASAGDKNLGDRYVDEVSLFVWSAADRPNFVDDVQAMRRRVEAHIPASVAQREVKLGPGGLRDVEFAVQLLQLVHGRSDVMLRSANTLSALEGLAIWGYVGREDASVLADSYRFLRNLEHRLQLRQLRRTHTMPEDEAEIRIIARSLGFRNEPVKELVDEWKRRSREVRRIHEKLFYRPLLQAVARLDAGEARLTPEAAQQRLQALGYLDPAGALKHLEVLSSGVSRRAAIQRTLLPVMLGWFADGPDPDSGLLGFRRVSEDLGSTPWYLRLLRDESAAAQRLAQILSSSRYATELLLRAPDLVTMLADDAELVPRSLTSHLTEANATVDRHSDPVVAVGALRASRRRELFRIAVGELVGVSTLDQAGPAISDVNVATINGALAVAKREARATHPDVDRIRFSVIGMGRFGGGELGFSSDLDVMFVYDAEPGVDETIAGKAAFAIANELRTSLMAPSADPPVEIDADLRPEGKQGPLVRSLASYAAYYERWSSPWEAQALLRAAPVAGDESLGVEFIALIDPLRYPENGLPEHTVREVRRLKARMEAERLPRGADPTLHVKLGRGGLSDVEWVAQLMQMEHGWRIPALRTTGTIAALAAAEDAGLLSAEDTAVLTEAWRLATRVRNAQMLARDRATDQVPTDTRERALVAYVLGYPLMESGRLEEDYRRVTRRARKVVERVFYGLDEA